MAFSLETIQYQHKDRFVPQLQDLIESLYSALGSGKYKTTNQLIEKHPSVKAIEELVFERFGMQVEISKDLYVLSPAAVIPFFGDYLREYREIGFYKTYGSGVKFGDIIKRFEHIQKDKIKVLKKIHNKSGYVDLKHARVGGYLSEIRHYLLLDFKWAYTNEITPEEFSAITCHELGHAFDGMEEHYRLQRVNRSIFDILVDLRDGQEDRALYTYRNTFTETQFQQARLSDDKVRQDFCGKLALEYIGAINSQYLDDKYDETNYENMADSFATRMGLGQELVSGLHKLHLGGGAVVVKNPVTPALNVVFEVLVIASVLMVVPVYGTIAYASIVYFLLGKRNENMTYDLPIDRYQRVRNTLVNALKDTKLPKDVVEGYLEQIAFVDNLIEGFMHTDFSVSETLSNWINPSNRKAVYYIELQQKLEKALNNSLFVKSAQLRVM